MNGQSLVTWPNAVSGHCLVHYNSMAQESSNYQQLQLRSPLTVNVYTFSFLTNPPDK